MDPQRSPWESLNSHQSFEENSIPGPSKAKWLASFLITLIVVGGVLLGGGFLVYRFFFAPGATPDVDVSFVYATPVYTGVPFSLTLASANMSDETLKDVSVSIVLPDDVSFVGHPQEQKYFSRAIGDLGPQSIDKQVFEVITTTQDQSIKPIDVKLNYASAKNPKYQFEKHFQKGVEISQSAVALTVNVPQNIYSGEKFDLAINYKNTTSQNLQGLRLKIDYPQEFRVIESSVKPEKPGQSIWNIGNLKIGESGIFILSGILTGSENSFYPFPTVLTADLGARSYVVNTQTPTLTIYPSLLSVRTELENNPSQDNTEYFAQPGDVLDYKLTVRNNSTFSLQGVMVKATLKGDLFDFVRVRTNGAFDSIRNIVTWTAANVEELRDIPPGQERVVQVGIPLKSDYPARSINDKNFLLRVDASAETPIVPRDTAAERTKSASHLITRVRGALKVDARAFWRDAAAKILNNGPYPPKINVPTQYTIHWVVSAYGTDMDTIHLSAALPGSRWTGTVKSNINTQPTYNPNTGEVIWDIPHLNANTGVLGVPAAEAIFQIENIPSINQAGSNVPLVTETKISGMDAFIKQHAEGSDVSLDSSLPDDTSIKSSPVEK